MPIRSTLHSLAVAAGLVACGSPGTSQRAKELVRDGATLLDVRTPGEFAAGHLEGALNIPVAELGRRLSEVPVAVPVVVYCRSGVRSANAAQLLTARGYEVLDLGAMGNW